MLLSRGDCVCVCICACVIMKITTLIIEYTDLIHIPIVTPVMFSHSLFIIEDLNLHMRTNER